MSYKPVPATAGTCRGCDRHSTELRQMTGGSDRKVCPSCIEIYKRGDLLPRERARVQLAYLGHLPMTGGPA